MREQVVTAKAGWCGDAHHRRSTALNGAYTVASWLMSPLMICALCRIRHWVRCVLAVAVNEHLRDVLKKKKKHEFRTRGGLSALCVTSSSGYYSYR
ncbi:hypothetical protein ACLK19_06385 [Escherichia coli]